MRQYVTPHIVLSFGLLVVAPVFGSDSAPESVVNAFHETLTKVMHDSDDLGYVGRGNYLEPAIVEYFDLPSISRLVSGRYWKSMDQTQRQEMTHTFSALIVATYASRFNEHSGEIFKIIEVRPIKQDRRLIRSQLIKSNGEGVSIDYVLHQRDEVWQIINVIADGVSDLSVKRAEYASVMAASGFEPLIERLNEQIDDLSQSH